MSKHFAGRLRQVIALSVLLLAGCGGPAAQPLPPLVSSEEMADTDVLPFPSGPIVPGRNYVYCATFQLAWDELRDVVFKEPIRLSGAPPMAAALVAAAAPVVKLDDESYLARAGLVSQGILEEIRREVRQRFPRSDFTVPDADAQSIVAYAFLEKSLPFAEKFDRLREPIAFVHAGGTAHVAGFGFRGDLKEAAPRTNRLLGQISALSFANSNDFVIRLEPKASADSIVLAKVPPEPTLEATFKVVKRRIDAGGEHDSYVGSNEIVAIPLISLGALRRYAELEDRTVENSPWREENYYVKHADQEIRFRLDETGAAVSSQARNEYAKSAPTSRPEPRAFVFDRPFLLWLQRAGASDPYLALWIETPELLVRAGK